MLQGRGNQTITFCFYHCTKKKFYCAIKLMTDHNLGAWTLIPSMDPYAGHGPFYRSSHWKILRNALIVHLYNGINISIFVLLLRVNMIVDKTYISNETSRLLSYSCNEVREKYQNSSTLSRWARFSFSIFNKEEGKMTLSVSPYGQNCFGIYVEPPTSVKGIKCII
jgi:hypothetical protein